MAARAQPMVPVREPIAITCHLAHDKQVFAGETFRATIRFRNDAPYPLEKLTYTVDIQTPSQRRITLHKSTVAAQASKEQREAVVEYRLAEPNEYLFRVSVSYTDFTGELKNITPRPERIMAPKALDESLRKVHLVKAPSSSAATVAAAGPSTATVDPSSGNSRYMLTIAIINKSSTAVRLTHIRFVPKDPNVVVIAQPRIAATPMERTSHGEAMPVAMDHEEFTAYDTMRFVAEVQVRKPSAPVAAAPSDAIFFSSSAASVTTSHLDLGNFEWAWSRDPEVRGTDASAVYRVARGPADPEMQLQVLAVYPPMPRVGDAITLTLQVTNNSAEKRDVSVAAHIAKLLPQFLYNGPMLSAIGTVAPGASILTYVHLIAHYPGFCSLVGALELRDTARPEVTLWPVFPNSSPAGGGGGATSLIGAPVRADGQQIPTMQVTASEGWPPKLADIFVTYPGDSDDSDDEDDVPAQPQVVTPDSL